MDLAAVFQEYLAKAPAAKMNSKTIFQQAQLVVVSLQAVCLDSDAYKAISDHLNDDGRQVLSMCQGLKGQNLPILFSSRLLCEHAKWVLCHFDEQDISYLAIILQHFSVPSRVSFDQLIPFIWHLHYDYFTAIYKTYAAAYSDTAECLPEEMKFRGDVSNILHFLKESLRSEWNVVWKCISEETLTTNPPPQAVSSFSWRPHIGIIYAGLVCVEQACCQKFGYLKLDSPNVPLKEIEESIPLARLLLHLHLENFRVSGSQCASFAMKHFLERNKMPQRMWQHGIGPLLDLLRQNLSAPFEEALIFQGQVYEVVDELRRTAPAFRYTWMETLGDLARYGMALNVDTEARMIWAERAKKWYSQVSASKPTIGRLHHHLAIVSQPDILKQLFHYTKSLLSVDSFPATEQSICSLFDRPCGSEPHDQLEIAFIAAHGHLFKQCSIPGLRAPVKDYLSQLNKHIDQAGEVFRQQGAYMLLCNFASILQYGSRTALLPLTFESAILQQGEKNAQTGDASEMILCGSYFAFETFSIILDQVRNENVYPAVYVSLVFIWCMSRNDTTGYIDEAVPWEKIVAFLNGMLCKETDFSVIEGDKIPIVGNRKQMPEDFLIHGYVWSQGYFPNNFFENAQDDGYSFEEPFMRASRVYRCLWLARQLCKYFEYSRKGFELTALAQGHEKAIRYDPFDFQDSSGEDA